MRMGIAGAGSKEVASQGEVRSLPSRHGRGLLSQLWPAPDLGPCGAGTSSEIPKVWWPGREAPVVETSAVLASAGDRVVGGAGAALEGPHQAPCQGSGPEGRRRSLRNLSEPVPGGVREGDTEPIIVASRQIAADRF